MSDAGPLFEAALAELNVDLPTEDSATQLILRHYIRSIADGSTAPYDGLDRLVSDVHQGANLDQRTWELAGDSHGIQDLVGAYDSYQELRIRPHEVSYEGKYGEDALAALDGRVVEMAEDWLTQDAA